MEGKEFKIGEHVYTVCPFTGERGLELLFELTQYMGAAGDTIKGLTIDQELSLGELLEDDKFVIDIISRILQNLPKVLSKKSIPFIKNLIEHVTIDGKFLKDQVVFDSTFACNYTELFVLVGKVIKINFIGEGKGLKDFFTDLLEKAKALKT